MLIMFDSPNNGEHCHKVHRAAAVAVRFTGILKSHSSQSGYCIWFNNNNNNNWHTFVHGSCNSRAIQWIMIAMYNDDNRFGLSKRLIRVFIVCADHLFPLCRRESVQICLATAWTACSSCRRALMPVTVRDSILLPVRAVQTDIQSESLST